MKKVFLFLFGGLLGAFLFFGTKVSALDVRQELNYYEVTIPEFTYYQYMCNEGICTFNKNMSMTASITIPSHELANIGYSSPSSRYNGVVANADLSNMFHVYSYCHDGYMVTVNNYKSFREFSSQLHNYYYYGKSVAEVFNAQNYAEGNYTLIDNLVGVDVGALANYGIDLTDREQVGAFINVIEDMYNNSANYVHTLDQYQRGYEDGVESVDITSDNQEVYDSAYQTGYDSGVASVDITSDNEQVHDEAYQNGFEHGVASVDITSDNEEIWSEAYQEGYDDGYVVGYDKGEKSVDTSAIEEEAYNRGYEAGYLTGFSEGEYSVDITQDNDTAIHLYITQNKYHTDFDFNLNFELGKLEGIKYVHDNVQNDEVVTKYVTDYIYVNNYKTQTEFIDNYSEGYDAGYDRGYELGLEDGKDVVYRYIESDPVVAEYYKTKLMNGTNIVIHKDGDENTYLIKDYNISVTDTGDFRIIIHYGQDTTNTEVIEEVVGIDTSSKDDKIVVKESTDLTSLLDFFKGVGIMIGGFIVIAIVIFAIRGTMNNLSKKGGRKYERQMA